MDVAEFGTSSLVDEPKPGSAVIDPITTKTKPLVPSRSIIRYPARPSRPKISFSWDYSLA